MAAPCSPVDEAKCGRARPVKEILNIRRLIGDRRAVTALEYGIIAGVLGLVLISIFTTFGSKLSTLFSNIGKSI